MKSSIILILLIPTFLFGQKRISVTDTEIEFSYELPKYWKTFDDGLSLFLIPPSQFKDENLSITYVETDNENLNESFEMTLKYFYPNNEPNFELIKQGEYSSSERTATWAIFDSTINGVAYRSYIFHFIENNQWFKLRGTARRTNFLNFKDQFEQVCKSVKSRKK